MPSVTALVAIPLAVLMIRHGLHRARWQRRKNAQAAERRARASEDVYWLMFRKLDARLAETLTCDAFLGIVETPAPVNGSSPRTEHDYCECGAHVVGTPCYLPKFSTRLMGDDLPRDDWSRKVPPLADVVHFPPRVPA